MIMTVPSCSMILFSRCIMSKNAATCSSAKGAAKFDEEDFDRRLRERNGP